ncbi:hypothetical protein ANTPLA_LOCUS8819 [Anthophora plagiata]
MNEAGNLDDQYLLKCCQDLHLHLEGDFDGTEMFEEIKMFRQERFSSLAILSIEIEVANSIDFDDVIKDLMSKKARKVI